MFKSLPTAIVCFGEEQKGAKKRRWECIRRVGVLARVLEKECLGWAKWRRSAKSVGQWEGGRGEQEREREDAGYDGVVLPFFNPELDDELTPEKEPLQVSFVRLNLNDCAADFQTRLRTSTVTRYLVNWPEMKVSTIPRI